MIKVNHYTLENGLRIVHNEKPLHPNGSAQYPVQCRVA